MTKEKFLYGLNACGVTYHNGQKFYEHDDLVKCFEDLGIFEQEPSRKFEDYEKEIEDLQNQLDIAEHDKERLREEVTKWNLKATIKALEQEPCEDAISRQAVQDYIAKYLSQFLYDDVRQAIEVIDEYIGELPSVKPQVICPSHGIDCEDCPAYEPKTDVLDKIRAEIDSLHNGCGLFNDGIDKAIDIIDKYRSESEEQA